MYMQNNNSSRGLGFLDALQIVFIVLKLTHVIDWSWWLVLIPLWIGATMLVCLLVYAAIVHYKYK